jgi:hypothetical protein
MLYIYNNLNWFISLHNEYCSEFERPEPVAYSYNAANWYPVVEIRMIMVGWQSMEIAQETISQKNPKLNRPG